MDGLGLEAGDQIGLTVERRLDLVLIDLGRCRRIVAGKPLGLGAAHQRLDQNRRFRRGRTQAVHLHQGPLEHEIRRCQARAHIPAHNLAFLIQHPRKGL